MSRDFCVWFFSWISSPQPQSIPLRPFRIFSKGVVDTGGKFATGINNAIKSGGKICRQCHWYRGQICHRCRWYRWCTLTYEYLREFSEKFETVLTEYFGARGKLIHEQNQQQKILWHCLFKGRFDQGHNIQGTLCPMDAISKKTAGDELTLHRLNVIYAEAPNKVPFFYKNIHLCTACVMLYIYLHCKRSS